MAHIWTDYLIQFGLRSKTGIDLPFEEDGQYEFHPSNKFENGISALLNASWGGNEVHTLFNSLNMQQLWQVKVININLKL